VDHDDPLVLGSIRFIDLWPGHRDRWCFASPFAVEDERPADG
jgi:hypothetical protein